MGIILGTIAGLAIGAVVVGASAAAGVPSHGLSVALAHIPPSVHGYTVVTAVKGSIAGGVAGGGIGAAVSAAAKGLATRVHPPIP